ncbi:uncharacterized protein [Palaemon carinicauda]|uniref:uncharacterized protein n=1 Tax=Palaemon carinicauda TaxID=392227 RepID=UPI0035B63D99
MPNQPGKILKFFGNLVIILLFAANVVAAWKDLSTPYWLFNFVMLGITFYLLNSMACCFEDDFDSSDFLGSYPVIGYTPECAPSDIRRPLLSQYNTLAGNPGTRQGTSGLLGATGYPSNVSISSDASCVYVRNLDEAVEATSEQGLLPKIEESPIKKGT